MQQLQRWGSLPLTNKFRGRSLLNRSIGAGLKLLCSIPVVELVKTPDTVINYKLYFTADRPLSNSYSDYIATGAEEFALIVNGHKYSTCFLLRIVLPRARRRATHVYNGHVVTCIIIVSIHDTMHVIPAFFFYLLYLFNVN